MSTDERATESVTLADGRTLDVGLAGVADGPTVVVHHGTPGSSMLPPGLVAAARARGLRVVAPSRAGYAGSTRDEGRDVAAAAGDVAEVADALGIGAFATLGWSGGGPHALACAATLRGRCVAALSVAGVAPYLPDEFDWTAGMGEENLEEFGLSLEGSPAYDEMLAGARDVFLATSRTDVTAAHDLFGGLVSEVDDATARDDVWFLLENVQHALAPGIGGWRDDDQAFLRPWGFEVTEIEVPVSLWFGGHDLMVPATHGGWLASHLGDVRVHHEPGEGHLSVWFDNFAALLDDLCETVGADW